MKHLKQILDPTLLRFLCVGVVNTAAGSGVMFGLYNLAGLHALGQAGYWLSTAANYLVGSVVSFFLNRHFTFRSSERGPAAVCRFILNILLCYLTAYGLALPAAKVLFQSFQVSSQVLGNVTMLFGAGLFVILNYLGQRYFVFRQRV